MALVGGRVPVAPRTRLNVVAPYCPWKIVGKTPISMLVLIVPLTTSTRLPLNPYTFQVLPIHEKLEPILTLIVCSFKKGPERSVLTFPTSPPDPDCLVSLFLIVARPTLVLNCRFQFCDRENGVTRSCRTIAAVFVFFKFVGLLIFLCLFRVLLQPKGDCSFSAVKWTVDSTD